MPLDSLSGNARRTLTPGGLFFMPAVRKRLPWFRKFSAKVIFAKTTLSSRLAALYPTAMRTTRRRLEYRFIGIRSYKLGRW